MLCLLVGGRETIPVIVGGVLSGILTVSIGRITYIVQVKLKKDSSIGIVFPFLFAIGVILVTQAGNVHIDAQHVLYGSIEFVPFDTLYLMKLTWDQNLFGFLVFWQLQIFLLLLLYTRN